MGLKNTESDTKILLCDFGYCKYIPDQGRGFLQTHCGTPQYSSPEIVLGNSYRCEVGMWSIGCIAYMLLCGIQPFADDDECIVYKMIADGDWAFGYNDDDRRLWENKISSEAKQLITNLFEMDPDKRYNCHEALKSSWFTDCAKFKLK